jgi:hypothetical protein
MAPDIDTETKLKLYMLIVNRYKDLISKQEERSVTEIRQRISPYGEEVKALRKRLIADIAPYEYERDFMPALQRVLAYMREIKPCKFLLTFWMSFSEMDELRIGGVMDKSLLLAALLRSLDGKDVRVIVTKSERIFVGFGWKGERYLIVPESGSMLSGDDAAKPFSEDPQSYSFSDLSYENYEES